MTMRVDTDLKLLKLQACQPPWTFCLRCRGSVQLSRVPGKQPVAMIQRLQQLPTIWCKRCQFLTHAGTWQNQPKKRLKPANLMIYGLFRSEADGARTRNLWIDSPVL